MSRDKSRIAKFFDWLSVWRAGGHAVFLWPGGPPPDDVLHGLVIGGGDDIGADLYGSEIVMDVRIDRERDALELSLLDQASLVNLPVLGICRGAQMMNVFRGGTLYTDIRGLPRDKTAMRTVLAKKRVWLESDSRVRGILGSDEILVNSLHHQAIDSLGRDLRVSGRDRGDFVQAVEDTDHDFFVGVQWHPEFLVFRPGQQNLFRKLVAAASRFRQGPETGVHLQSKPLPGTGRSVPRVDSPAQFATVHRHC